MNKSKFLMILIALLILPAMAFGYSVDMNGEYGSFGSRASAGMWYDETDVLFNAPVRLWEFNGTALLTSFGNYRNYNNLNGATFLDWNDTSGTYYAVGAIGKPLWLLGMDSIRGGVYTFQLGSTTPTFDLNASGITNSEGNYIGITDNYNAGGTNTTTLLRDGKDMAYYNEQSIQVISVGLAYKLSDDMTFGVGLQLDKDINCLTTGGEKNFSDTAHLAVSPTPTLQQSAKIIYPENDGADMDSESEYAFNAQLGLKMGDQMKVNALLMLKLVSKNNPAQMKLSAIDVTLQNWNTDIYETKSATYDVTNINYDNYTWNLGSFGDTGEQGVTEYEDDRSGMDIGIAIDADYEYDKICILTPSVFFQTRMGMSIDAKATDKYSYIEKDRVAATTLDTYTHNNITELSKEDGSEGLTTWGAGVKIDFINLKDIKLAMGVNFSLKSESEEYTEKSVQTETWIFDDGVAGDSPAIFPNDIQTQALEGTYVINTTSSEEIEDSTRTITWAIPVGTVIGISERWNFKGGALYTKELTKRTVNTKDKNVNDTTVFTPAGGTAETTYSSSVINEEKESIIYGESSSTYYSYGVEFNYNENLKIECNGFLDGAGADILDLSTYSSLVLSASYRY